MGRSNIYLSLSKPARQCGISGELSEEPELLPSPNSDGAPSPTKGVSKGQAGNLHFCPHLTVTRWHPLPHTSTVSEKAFYNARFK